MAFSLTIAGISKDLLESSLHISQTANGRTTAAFSVLSKDASYRPAINAEVIIELDSVLIFAGLIDRPAESGFGGGARPGIVTEISAVDFNAYTERRYIKEAIPAGSMKAALTVVASYLAGYGVTLDAGQVDGPALPDLLYDYIQATDVLNEIATLTSDAGQPFVWNIDAFKVLSMIQPSSSAAPFDILTNLPGYVIGDITVEESREHYANKVIVKVPSRTEENHLESFTGNGSQTLFQLQFTPVSTRGYVTSNGVYETLNITGDSDPAMWTYDPSSNTINRNIGAPGIGAVIEIVFTGTFEGLGIADAGAPASDLVEAVIKVEEVPSDTTVQAMADNFLAQFLPITKTVRYKTFTPGLLPGQSQTITVPARNLDGDAVITDVVIRDQANRLIYEIAAVIEAQSNLGGQGWRDLYRFWSRDIAGTGGGAGDGQIAHVGPAGPNKSVQYNDLGKFGGQIEHTWDKETHCLIAGGGGCSITALVVESCQVFGFDNHIADP